MPDWKKDEDYAYTKSLTPGGWAFEFLRRNEEYQADYKHLRNAYNELEQKYGPKTEENLNQWFADPLFWHYDPPRFSNETNKKWLRRAVHQGIEPCRIKLHLHIAAKWGLLSFPPDPSCPANPPPRFSELGRFPMLPDYHQVAEFFEGDYPKVDPDGNEDWSSGAGPYAQRHGYAVVVFNLALPVGPQQEIAAKRIGEKQEAEEKAEHIETLKKYTPGQVVVLYKRYLRLLDGDTAGNSPSQMGPILFEWKGQTGGKGSDAIKSTYDSLKAAKKLVKRNYLIIPHLNFPSDQ